MESAHWILFYVSLLLCLIFFALLIGLILRAVVKKEPLQWSLSLLTFGGFVATLGICVVVGIPGAETNFKIDSIEVGIKTPGIVKKFFYGKEGEKAFKAINTNQEKTNRMIIFAASPDAAVNLKLIKNEDLLKVLKESPDGKQRMFLLTIPPGTEVSGTTSHDVMFNAFLPFGWWSKHGDKLPETNPEEMSK